MKQDAATKGEWDDMGRVDDAYYRMRHKPCGTIVFVHGGQPIVCPVCQPAEVNREPRENPEK